MGYGDSEFDPLGPFGASQGPALELDLPASSEPTGRLRGGALVREPEAQDEVPEDPGLPPRRALELARHGSPPALWLEVPYAIGVLRRRRYLRRALPALRRVCDATALDLEAATLELGRAVHDAREHPRADELGTALRIANARNRLANEGVAELARARAEAEATIEALEQANARRDEQLHPKRIRAFELRAQVVVFQQDFEAVSAVIEEATEELALIERSKADDANRRIELEAMRTNRRVEVDAALREIDARTPELGGVEAEIIELEEASAKAQALIDGASASLAQTKIKVGLEGADAAEAFEQALRDLADEAVRLRLDYVMVPSAARRARLHYDTLYAQQREIEMHELALTFFHRASLRRGLALVALLACAVLGWLAHLIA